MENKQGKMNVVAFFETLALIISRKENVKVTVKVTATQG